LLEDGETFQIEELGLWAVLEGDVLTVGVDPERVIDEEVSSIDLPEANQDVVMNDPVGSIKINNNVEEILSPSTGIISEINEELLGDPSALSEDPEGSGWLFKIEVQDRAELLTYF
jgi:glycine cleavage system H protein